ncbi:hypothetical protein [Methylopila sp. M107]|uniref:helix-turn-helix transcriptional regulator n=1 Tax=Methylopila sp. M107 TaxID=1101190 RepID=UPI00039ED2E0|nr:hypothetical protein [Methylopila sp. M107]
MLNLVEKIYEASATLERWPEALEAVSRRIGAAGGPFVAIDNGGARLGVVAKHSTGRQGLSAQATRLLRALLDLTSMEVRVAQDLLAGDVGEKTARRIGVSAEKLATHVKAVLRKTGLHQHVELVSCGPDVVKGVR